MRKTRVRLLFLMLLLLPGVSYSAKQVKTVVVFLPFNANMPSLQNFMDGFRSAISEDSDTPYNLLVEYLDIARSKDEAYVQHLVELYNEKVKGFQIDLLITAAPLTWSMLKKYGLESLDDTPTIRIEMDPPIEKYPEIILNKNTIEIKLKFRINETFKNAFELFPDDKDIYVISGNTSTDQYFTALMKQAANGFQEGHHFTFIDGITLDSTIRIAGKIPVNSIVFIPTYLSDKNKIPFSTPEAIRIISDNCKAPVFPIFDSFIKTRGGIGGFIFSYIFLGKETGRAAREFLDGKPLQDIVINEDRFYQYIYDWKQLKKWNLLTSGTIPSNSIFYNREFDFFTDYKWYLLMFTLFMIMETMLILYLIKLHRRQKEVGRQEKETETLYRQVIRESRQLTLVELTAALSHELNQPLTAILYSAQAGIRFLESEKLDHVQAKEIFENIIEDDKRAAGLISSVRSLMKLENREKERVNLNVLIQETVNIFHTEALKQHIQINQELHPVPVFVFGDKIQLQQVLLNFFQTRHTPWRTPAMKINS